MTPTVPAVAELVAPAHWRTVDFISDLHLQAGDEATFCTWQQYLAHTPADAVFMLGDLFEVWIGDDVLAPDAASASADPAFEARCARVLRAAAQRTPLFFMPGNRDFLLGEDFCQQVQMQCLPDPAVLTFASQRWLLTHGDALCLDDTDYQQFRLQVRSAPWQGEFLARPLAQRQQIARGIRQQSEEHKRSTASFADVDSSAARNWLDAARANVMIHGHTHRPAWHDLGQGRLRWVLSDWDCSTGEPRAEVLRLQRTDGGTATVRRIALPCA
jgi:UDP-2,3-diacylglucosamine hydrolase